MVNLVDWPCIPLWWFSLWCFPLGLLYGLKNWCLIGIAGSHGHSISLFVVVATKWKATELLTASLFDVYERFMVNKDGLKTELSNHMNHETITICTWKIAGTQTPLLATGRNVT